MKKLLIMLALLSSLAIAQDTPTTEPKTPPEVFVFEFEPQCEQPVMWAAQLMVGRNAGVTRDMVIADLAASRIDGPLKDFPEIYIDYLLVIIMIAFDEKTDVGTPEGAGKVLTEVQEVCLAFLEPPKKKETELRT